MYRCGIFLIIDLQYGRAVFETDHDLRVFYKPVQSTYEKLKQHDVEKCDRLDLEIKRIYHTKIAYRGYYNIYRIDIKRRSVYVVERYYSKGNVYDYGAFDSFEDALVYIYD